MKRKLKDQKGITLVALIITIVVMLIIATVTIRSVDDSEIIDKAQEAKSDFELAAEKEELKTYLLSWQLSQVSGEPTLQSFFETKYGTDKVQANEDGSVIVTVKSGNKYKVTENTEVTLLD